MASISQTIQNIIGSIMKLFRRKSTLETMSKDDLSQLKSKLELNENKILREIEKLEKQKEQLFEEATRERSESLRRAKARQIRDVDQRIRGLKATITPLGKRISILDRLIAQHDMGNFAPGTSEVIDILRQTDANELQKEIDNQLAEEMMQEEKLDTMAKTFRAAQEKDEAEHKLDEEVEAILAEIENAAIRDAEIEEVAFLQEQTPSSKETPSTEKEPPMSG